VPELFRVGDLEIRPADGIVRKGAETIQLTRTEFRVLCELAEHMGAVLSRDQLLERVWGYEGGDDSRTVDAHIRRLRTKIEDDPSTPRVLVTVRGLGYKLGVDA
jgi:DNA-binding response OmpR family regulator